MAGYSMKHTDDIDKLSKHFTRQRITALIAYAALWAAGIWMIHNLENRLDATYARGQRRACHRLNVTRVADNKSNHSEYLFFRSTGIALNGIAVRLHNRMAEDYASKLREFARQQFWIPLTSCSEAEREDYTDQPAYSFAQHEAPEQAYELTRNE